MIDTATKFMRFVFSKEARDIAKSISSISSDLKPDWKKNIQVISGKFNRSNWISINEFTEVLFDKVQSVGMDDKVFDRFRQVLLELIENAKQHGIMTDRKYKFTIRCSFSASFIQLEFAHNNKRVDFKKIAQASRNRRNSSARPEYRGFDLIDAMSDVLFLEKAKVLAIFSGKKTMHYSSDLITREDVSVWRVSVSNIEDASITIPDWSNLIAAIETGGFIEHHIILIGNQSTESGEKEVTKRKMRIDLPTVRVRQLGDHIELLSMFNSGWFAFVLDSDWARNNLQARLEKDNVMFFTSANEAFEWLLSRGNE